MTLYLPIIFLMAWSLGVCGSNQIKETNELVLSKQQSILVMEDIILRIVMELLKNQELRSVVLFLSVDTELAKYLFNKEVAMRFFARLRLDDELKGDRYSSKDLPFAIAFFRNQISLARLHFFCLGLNERLLVDNPGLIDGHAATLAHASLLLSLGLNINFQGRGGMSLLHLASTHGREATVQFLLSNKALLELEDDEGKTPFYCACEKGHYEAAKMLLKAGADLHHPRKDGRSVISALLQNGNVNVFTLLEKLQ